MARSRDEPVNPTRKRHGTHTKHAGHRARPFPPETTPGIGSPEAPANERSPPRGAANAPPGRGRALDVPTPIGRWLPPFS